MRGEAIFESLSEYDPDTCTGVIVQHLNSEAPTIDWIIKRPDRSQSTVRTNFTQNESTYETELEVINPAMQGGPLNSQQTQCPTWIGYDHLVHQKLWHDDPIGLQVNSSTMENWFWANGECVQWARSVYRSAWLSGSGWYLTGHGQDLYPLYEYEEMVSVGASAVRNDTFCGGGTTIAQYPLNEIRMYYDGFANFDWGLTVSGACASWLAPYRHAHVQ